MCETSPHLQNNKVLIKCNVKLFFRQQQRAPQAPQQLQPQRSRRSFVNATAWWTSSNHTDTRTTDRQTDKQTVGQSDGQTDRQTDRHRHSLCRWTARGGASATPVAGAGPTATWTGGLYRYTSQIKIELFCSSSWRIIPFFKKEKNKQ